MSSIVVRNLFIILVILALVFMSQQPQSRQYGKDLYGQASAYVQSWWQAGYNYVLQTIYPKIGGEVQKRQEVIKQELQQEKEKISQSLWQKIKNYLADILNRVFHPSSYNPTNQPSQAQ